MTEGASMADDLTPRTDAFYYERHSRPSDTAWLKFARVLEKELRERDAEIARLRQRAVDFFVNDGDESMAYDVLHDEDWLAAVLEYVEHMAAIAESAGVDAVQAINRARKAEGDLDSATQPLAPEMARLNANLTAANTRAEAAEQRAERLAGALRPFAEIALTLDGVPVDFAWMVLRARAALDAEAS